MLAATIKEASSVVYDHICQRFSLDEILLATQSFHEALVIGRGGFGEVYKGRLNINGCKTIVAIKRLHSMSIQGAPEFWVEIEMLCKLRHCNIVSLIGYCNEGIEMILVYEFMVHGTLADILSSKDAPCCLTWLQRLEICIGAARGLEYLHTGTSTQHGIIHRDVKSSNILLDDKLSAKVSDFGLAKICPTKQSGACVSTGVKGTFGYMDPCYFYTGKLTTKSDVYSFGVILLEVMCGRPALDLSLNDEECGLAPWAECCIKQGKTNQIIDFRLRGQASTNCLKQFALIACRCLDGQQTQRPTMSEIIFNLEHIFSLQKRLDSALREGSFIKTLRFIPSKVHLKARKWMSTRKTKGSKDAKKLTVDDSYSLFIHLLLQDAVMIHNTSYWTSYRAKMDNGDQVLVRRMKKDILWDEKSVLRKIQGHKKLCHENILAPKAFYYNKEETLYVHDYMNNGSISSFLHPRKGKEVKPLNLRLRMSMIVGITRGLAYLHTEEKIVHGYLTSRTVFLDNNYNPLIACVGLSLLTVKARPKLPFDHAPELLRFQDANMKTDVYSLGLIILELLTRKSSNSNRNKVNVPRWVMSIPRDTRVFDLEIVMGTPNIEHAMLRLLDLAMTCVNLSPNCRPEAYQVLQQVHEIAAVLSN